MSENTISIQLTDEQRELCAYSPIEVILYYITYPRQLYKDAASYNMNPFTLFYNSYVSAINYWQNKQD